jgi:hypothetical protein
MAGEQNTNQQSGGFGAPPAPEVNVRSMASDVKSIERGDASPVPESIVSPDMGREPVFRPETQAGNESLPMGDMGMNAEPKKSKSKVLLWSIVGVAVVAVGVIGYFAYPIIFPGTTEVVEIPPPVVPPVEPPPVQLQPHQSFFATAPAATAELRLSNLLYLSVVTALQEKTATKLPDDTLQEIVVMDDKGSQIPFKSYINTFAPNLTVQEIEKWFEDDFTAFVFYDKNGVWPGMAGKLKSGVNIDEARVALAALEASDVSRFYLSAPGTFTAFKAGNINGKQTRYSVGSQTGASFNYGVAGNYLVISTSFSGLKAVAPLLGF